MSSRTPSDRSPATPSRSPRAPGQFADALADGVAAFHLSWTQALEVTGRMSGNIAANVGHLQVDLDALDVASSS